MNKIITLSFTALLITGCEHSTTTTTPAISSTYPTEFACNAFKVGYFTLVDEMSEQDGKLALELVLNEETVNIPQCPPIGSQISTEDVAPPVQAVPSDVENLPKLRCLILKKGIGRLIYGNILDLSEPAALSKINDAVTGCDAQIK